MTSGKGNKKNVKNYFNCLHPPLLPIQLEDVTPPYLHILLGIVWRHHILLKKATHELDLFLLLQNTNTCTPAGLQLKEYGNSHACVENLREQMRVIEAFITFSDSEVERKKYETLHSKTEEELADLAFSNLNENSGPVSCSLIPILEANRIT